MSYLADFEHTKVDAQVFPGYIVQKHYLSSPTSGQRRVPISKIWQVEKLLGKGTFGEVRLETSAGHDNKDTRECRAVKRIWTTRAEFKKSYERELKAFLEFSKPKYKESAVFVEFLGWFEDTESVYLAMEYLPLGDLEDNVIGVGGSIREVEVKEIARQVCEGLRIMHLENFAHRDLKPKNVLVCQGPPNWWVKLADFGLTKRQTDETGLRTQTGTFSYMAPEILNYIPGVQVGRSKYTNAVDMWALGCIVYRLVCGVVPFPPGLSLVEFCKDESKCPSRSLSLSDDGMSFVKNLIRPHPAQRLTAQQALDHAWLNTDLVDLEAAEDNPDSIAFSGYDTVTHLGLRSQDPASLSSPTVKAGAAKGGTPKGYRPPAVEDEETTTIEIELPDAPRPQWSVPVTEPVESKGQRTDRNKQVPSPGPKPLETYSSPPSTFPSRNGRSPSRNAGYPIRTNREVHIARTVRFAAGRREEDEYSNTESDSDRSTRPPSRWPDTGLEENRDPPAPVVYRAPGGRARPHHEPTVYKVQDSRVHLRPSAYRVPDDRAHPFRSEANSHRINSHPPRRKRTSAYGPVKYEEANGTEDSSGPTVPLTAEMLKRARSSGGPHGIDESISEAGATISSGSRSSVSYQPSDDDEYERVDYLADGVLYQEYSRRHSAPTRSDVFQPHFRENQPSNTPTDQTKTVFYADENGYIDTYNTARPAYVETEAKSSNDYSKKDGTVPIFEKEGRDKEPEGVAKVQQTAKAALLAGGTEAIRARNEPGGWGVYHNPDAHNKRHILEAIVGGLAGYRLIHGSRNNIEDDRGSVRFDHSRYGGTPRKIRKSKNRKRSHMPREHSPTPPKPPPRGIEIPPKFSFTLSRYVHEMRMRGRQESREDYVKRQRGLEDFLFDNKEGYKNMVWVSNIGV